MYEHMGKHPSVGQTGRLQPAVVRNIQYERELKRILDALEMVTVLRVSGVLVLPLKMYVS